ncbi:response regulator [Pseudobdellovibrio sp. HCB154]|uniref:response regulator n=1 Tax=Pseudobdellovibrio sp. HCB154 TaxID=3386277 RepID=UPI003916F33A
MVQTTLNFDWARTELGSIETWDSGLINSLRIVFNCPIGMYCCWGPRRRFFYNDAYIPILKHRHPKALGCTLDTVWPEVWEQVHAIVLEIEAGRTVLESDVLFYLEVDGEIQSNYFTYGNSPLFNSEGKISGMLCTILDTTKSVVRTRVTEENLTQAMLALQSAKNEAEIANQAKSSFLANMSHEIRTPIGAILGFAEIMRTQDLAVSERKKYLDTVIRNGKSLIRIIDDILDLSKIEAGKLEIELTPVKLNSLLQEVLAMFFDHAARKHIQLVYEASGIDDLVVLTDATRTRQVLVNLIGNAVKFTSKGSVKISCRADQATKTHKKITFTIEDSGIGMTQEQADRLFKPFTQADITSTRRYGGTGLGLALSKNLAHALDGDVKILNCKPGHGCVFEFSLHAEETAEIITTTPSASLTAEVQNSLRGLKVLAVDDSQDNRELIKMILNSSGLDVTEAESGEQAIDQAFKQHYDIVLMDIQMPGIDGYSTLAELRKRGFQEPVIALTAHAMKEEKNRTLAAGFADHVTKPINSKTLLQTIQSHVRHH